jgi:hypothetical protein
MVLALATWALPAFADSLEQSDVDRFIARTPAVSTVISSVDRRLSKEEKQRFQSSVKTMRPFTTMADMVEDKPDNVMLDGISQKVGYDNFEQYAQVADRFFSVVTSALMVETLSGMLEENPEKINDLFSYLEDPSKSEEKQQRLAEMFEEVCQKSCVNPEDADIVARNYLALGKVLRLKK